MLRHRDISKTKNRPRSRKPVDHLTARGLLATCLTWLQADRPNHHEISCPYRLLRRLRQSVCRVMVPLGTEGKRHRDDRRGILPDQRNRRRCSRRARSPRERPLDADQIQPASLDLRLGAKAYRVRASFLPGPRPHGRRQARPPETARDRSVRRRGAGNRLRLYRAAAGKPGAAGRHRRPRPIPKSSTGRLDIFTRVITDHGAGVRQDPGRLSRPALSRGQPAHLPDRRAHRLAPVADPLPPRPARCSASRARCAARGRDAGRRRRPPTSPAAALPLSIDLPGDAAGLVGYRGKHHTGVVDVDKRAAHDVLDFWEPLYSRGRQRTDPRSRRILHPRRRARPCMCRRTMPPR